MSGGPVRSIKLLAAALDGRRVPHVHSGEYPLIVPEHVAEPTRVDVQTRDRRPTCRQTVHDSSPYAAGRSGDPGGTSLE